MTIRRLPLTSFLLFAWLAAPTPHARAQTSAPVVHVVLFFSPTCPHCHLVITETLPPLLDRYGDQLQLAQVDISTPDGQALLMAAAEHFNLEDVGVPLIVVGDQFLMGSVDIPEQLPGLIEASLLRGGADWPDIPGLREALSLSAPADDAPAWQKNFNRDPAGNSLAVLVLAGMIVLVVNAIGIFRRKPNLTPGPRWNWWIPVLSLIGLGIAGYLLHVEVTRVEAVCGPVGDCNAVQQSSYARLFGILPVGLLGLAGYALILALWLYGRYAKNPTAYPLTLTLTGAGLLFSIYLTFLEPFVIGATCAWCLMSSVIMSVLFWLSLPLLRPHMSPRKALRRARR